MAAEVSEELIQASRRQMAKHRGEALASAPGDDEVAQAVARSAGDLFAAAKELGMSKAGLEIRLAFDARRKRS